MAIEKYIEKMNEINQLVMFFKKIRISNIQLEMQNSPQNCISKPGPHNKKIEVLKLYIKTLRENKIIQINRIIIKKMPFQLKKLINK